MPLVDYGSSDESDSEESNGGEKSNEIIEKNEKEGSKVNNDNFVSADTNNDGNTSDQKLFANLPLPKSAMSIAEDSLKLLKRNKSQPVKIILPSLNELKADNTEVKKPKASAKGSGLFALLPAPKHTSSLVPKSVQKSSVAQNIPKPLQPPKLHKAPVLKQSSNTKSKCEDGEEDDSIETPKSFFFTDDEKIESVEVEEFQINANSAFNNDSKVTNTKFDIPEPSHTTTIQENRNVSYQSFENKVVSETEPLEIQNSMDLNDLNDEAIEKLCGTRARKRKGEVPEEIIDINVQSMVGDAYMWLSKDLTKEPEHRSFKKTKNLSVVERRKHQITYLASQAKEKEMELRNHWANSRLTRKQTQSKYGF